MSKVAFIGLGNMGCPMAINLVKAGHELTVWNRTAAKADPVVAEGAKLAASPKAAAEGAEFVITMVADGPTLQAVAFGPDGYIAALKPGMIAIDMSTVAPAESQKVADAIEAAGCKLVRAPVTGSTALAAAAKLGILASGDKAAYEKALPLFEKLGANQWYLGGGEEARTLKLAINTMIGSEMQLEAEAVVLCEKAGLDVAQVTSIIAGSAAGSPLCGYKAALITGGEYAPAFSVKLMMKDLDLALAAAKQYGVAMPATALTRQMLGAASALGYAEKDFSILTKVLEEMCGYQR